MTEIRPFVGLDVAQYTNLDVHPESKSYPGPCVPPTLNAFFALPEQLKPLFQAGLKMAAERLNLEVGNSVQQEEAYGAMADNFAGLVDPQYRQTQETLQEINPGLTKLREVFYYMIRTAEPQHLENALNQIQVPAQAV